MICLVFQGFMILHSQSWIQSKRASLTTTNKKYDSYFSKFKSWCRQFNLEFLPATASTVTTYLTSLIQSGCSVSVLNAVKWYHDMHLFDDRCSNKLVNIVLEGGTRIWSKPIKKKELITADIIHKLFNFYKNNLDLYNSRSFCMFLLAYAGFFRYKDFSNIRMTNIAFYDTHIEILVETSKTDIYRQGNKVVIARTNTETCPVLFLRRYCTLAGLNLDSN